MNDILDEVDQELKQEKLNRLISNSVPYIICLMVVIIAGLSIWVVWQNHLKTENERLTDIYSKAIILMTKGEEAASMESLDHVMNEARGTIAALAGLEKAKILKNQGKIDQSIELYTKIYHNKAIDLALKDLAGLMLVSAMIEHNKDSHLEKQLALITQKHSPFKNEAELLKACWMLKNGKSQEAKELLRSMISDTNSLGSNLHKRVEAVLAGIDSIRIEK